MTISDRQADCANAVCEAVNAAVAAPAGTARIEALRVVADRVIDLREAHTSADGGPDLRGASYAYRQTYGAALTNSDIPAGDLETWQQAIRYHVSNALRERLDAGTLEALDLREESARERAAESRARRTALVEAARKALAVTDPEAAREAERAAAADERARLDAAVSRSPDGDPGGYVNAGHDLVVWWAPARVMSDVVTVSASRRHTDDLLDVLAVVNDPAPAVLAALIRECCDVARTRWPHLVPEPPYRDPNEPPPPY